MVLKVCIFKIQIKIVLFFFFLIIYLEYIIVKKIGYTIRIQDKIPVKMIEECISLCFQKEKCYDFAIEFSRKMYCYLGYNLVPSNIVELKSSVVFQVIGKENLLLNNKC